MLNLGAPDLCPKCGAYWHTVGYHYVWTPEAMRAGTTPRIVPRRAVPVGEVVSRLTLDQ